VCFNVLIFSNIVALGDLPWALCFGIRHLFRTWKSCPAPLDSIHFDLPYLYPSTDDLPMVHMVLSCFIQFTCLGSFILEGRCSVCVESPLVVFTSTRRHKSRGSLVSTGCMFPVICHVKVGFVMFCDCYSIGSIGVVLHGKFLSRKLSPKTGSVPSRGRYLTSTLYPTVCRSCLTYCKFSFNFNAKITESVNHRRHQTACACRLFWMHLDALRCVATSKHLPFEITPPWSLNLCLHIEHKATFPQVLENRSSCGAWNKDLASCQQKLPGIAWYHVAIRSNNTALPNLLSVGVRVRIGVVTLKLKWHRHRQ
jgi:hypothetical protein